MDSLAALKADQGKAGSERQMADIARLRRELESKQEKINELRQVCRLPQHNLVSLCTSQYSYTVLAILINTISKAGHLWKA